MHTHAKDPIIRMSLKSLKYLEHKEANHFLNLDSSIHRQ
jgi:hypothetical protein